jgi:hypothetical protein
MLFQYAVPVCHLCVLPCYVVSSMFLPCSDSPCDVKQQHLDNTSCAASLLTNYAFTLCQLLSTTNQCSIHTYYTNIMLYTSILIQNNYRISPLPPSSLFSRAAPRRRRRVDVSALRCPSCSISRKFFSRIFSILTSICCSEDKLARCWKSLVNVRT